MSFKFNLGFAILAALVFLLGACETTNENWQADADRPQVVHDAMQHVTDVIVHDIFSPPQAARIYAYASIAAYEAGRHAEAGLLPLADQLNGFSPPPAPEPELDYAYSLSAAVALLELGKHLTFSEYMLEDYRAEIEQNFLAINMPSEVYDRSVAYGDAVAAHVISYSGTDNYKQSRTFPKFSINNDPARWRPTPPDYMDGIEPHWQSIRPFLLDSAQQFKPLPPPEFSLEKDSKFYTDLLEVYTALDEEPEQRVAIASFWDCNPFVSHHRGHVMFATKKISPGGHWMGIAKSVAEHEQADFSKTLETYLRVSLSLADGFISCWDEKYRSKLVRPETLINEYIDPDWLPALQTPPFPEYTSGHSVISRSAAVAMSGLYGDNYHYVDSVEVDWGLPARTFDSFYDASEEAAVSRLYGGIHYGPAIWEGVKQGQRIGEFVEESLVTRPRQTSMAN